MIFKTNSTDSFGYPKSYPNFTKPHQIDVIFPHSLKPPSGWEQWYLDKKGNKKYHNNFFFLTVVGW